MQRVCLGGGLDYKPYPRPCAAVVAAADALYVPEAQKVCHTGYPTLPYPTLPCPTLPYPKVCHGVRPPSWSLRGHYSIHASQPLSSAQRQYIPLHKYPERIL